MRVAGIIVQLKIIIYIDNDQRILDDVKSDLYSNSCLNSFLCRDLF